MSCGEENFSVHHLYVSQAGIGHLRWHRQEQIRWSLTWLTLRPSLLRVPQTLSFRCSLFQPFSTIKIRILVLVGLNIEVSLERLLCSLLCSCTATRVVKPLLS